MLVLTPKCENAIVERDVPIVEDWLSWVFRVEREEELREGDHEVFIEEIENAFRNTDVIQTAVVQYQFPQELELTNRIVTRLHSTHSFIAINADSNMSFLDHIYIVGTVTDRKGDLIQLLFHETNNFCLLFRSHTTAYNTLGVLNYR